ncbi:S8 family serine peptidase [Actinoallomurus spadix]|uniref:S8 family serine peptidase n=1 Tax=Actinoallomurus spadix TaxID=79912 RepID=UPI002093B7D8|nr:S8 family serine peptidase [Actinoallomurus spadix]MCO5985077.1 S8 family serine peptidase [Actinoallomurus spadix]
MSRVKPAAFAVAGALTIASLTSVQTALALGKPTAGPTSKSSPRPTVTKSVTKSVTVTPTPKATRTSPTPAPRPSVTCNPDLGVPSLNAEPWAQKRLDFTRAWKLTRGKGVTVAVVDSGVDATQRQLSGRVALVDVSNTIKRDCLGHGTAVAGIIGARDMRDRNMPFVGVAPEANLISVKFTNQMTTTGTDPHLAKAIREAADLKAKVINVSVQAPDSPALRAAVKYAQARDAVIVAAAGNVQGNGGAAAGAAYPAEYPGVISVGSLNEDGTVADSSNVTTRVSVAAPGKNLATTWPGGYAPAEEGTSFASAFVSGTVALVRAYHPDLDHQQVKQRIEATADGSVGTGSGAGMINPMLAVSALLPGEQHHSVSPAPAVPARPVQVAYRRPPDRRTRSVALTIAGVALAGAAVVVAGGVLIPMGRRRNWQPGSRAEASTKSDA